MRRSKTTAAALYCLLTFLAGTAHAFECKVCHSKNPAMVRMHKAVQGRGCFDCHRVGEKLMGKGQPKDRESLLKRRVADPLCVECHKQG
ncbi:MAG: cytochrome c3 family protein [Geobacteraceae bacterium]|nr:cytochrome c3 family protein [Geobacteraceae bacterium]